MEEQRKALNAFWNASADLAESVQRNIITDGCIDDETVDKLYVYQQSALAIANYMDILNLKKVTLN